MFNHRFGLGLATFALFAVLAGCNNSEAPAPSGGPGGPGGPGGMRRGGPGGGGGPVDASASGADIFKQKCSGCHGADGHGARGPSLVSAAGDSEAELQKTISDGKGKMPPFKGQLSDDQVKKVAAYVKTLK
jgi:mono/diheme cytochrome c family protein